MAAANLFKTKISFVRLFSLLTYLYVMSLNFNATEHFMSLKAYVIEELSLIDRLTFVRSRDTPKLFLSGFFLLFMKPLGRA